MQAVTDGIGWLNPLSVLGAADMDYVAARSLLLSALLPSGQAKAAEAVEKLLKLFLICEAGARTGTLLTPKEVRKFGHGLSGLFRNVIDRLRDHGIEPLDSEGSTWIVEFLGSLQTAYDRRYPDQWAMVMGYSTADLPKLDAVYVWLRNHIVPNLPLDQQEQAKMFGVSFSRTYTREVLGAIRASGSPTPYDLLRQHNEKLAEMDIRHDLLPP